MLKSFLLILENLDLSLDPAVALLGADIRTLAFSCGRPVADTRQTRACYGLIQSFDDPLRDTDHGD